MAGGFPPSMGVKKNKFIEEWNGKREITERSFKIDYADVPTFLIMIVIIPYSIYSFSRRELVNNGNPRYKDLI
jgi:hypothetical protein